MAVPSQRKLEIRGEELDLLDVVGCGIWIYDGDDTRYVNGELSRITGYSVEELLTPGFFSNLVHPQDKDMIVERGKAKVRGEPVPETYEVRVIARSGEVRTLAITGRRLMLAGGPVSLVSAVDVTPLREAEDTIRSGATTVVELLHSLPAHIITTDAAGKPTFVNRHWLELTGQSELEAMESGTARLIHPDDAPLATERWLHALRTGEGYDIDYRVRDANGEFRWQNFRIRPLVGPEHTRVGWTSASVDIHDQRMLAQMLAETNQELTRAIEAKDEVLGLISHELRTPLTTLLGNARLLRRHGERLSNDERLGVATDLEADALRLESVIANMLVLSRTNSAEPVESEPLRLPALASEVLKEFGTRHPDRALELRVQPGLPMGVGNAVHFRQILGNLLSNAVKYGPVGSRIQVEMTVTDGMIETSVLDEGPGLSDGDRAQVFEAFFRSESHAKIYGIGLGLTVCRRLVELYGGTISVRNRTPTGCAFTFTTPTLADTPDTE